MKSYLWIHQSPTGFLHGVYTCQKKTRKTAAKWFSAAAGVVVEVGEIHTIREKVTKHDV